MLGTADFGRPKNFHEIARLRFGEVIEVPAQVHLIREARRAGAVGVPSAPNAFAVALTTNHQAFESRMIEIERTLRAQGLDRFHEDEVGRAGAVARRGRVRHNEEFSGFEMSGGLEGGLA